MTASTITGILLLLALAAWVGYSIGRFVEKGVWAEIIATLYSEAGTDEFGERRRGTLDVVWWRRKEVDL